MPVAVVTGSSSGIGLATAQLLVQRGYSVVMHGWSRLGQIQSAASKLRVQLAPGARIACVVTDIANQSSCQQLVQSCFHWNAGIDLWVNNAGADVLTGGWAQASFEERLRRLWEVDVLGTIRLSRLVAHRMQLAMAENHTASIINVGWDQAMLGMEGDPGQLFGTIKAAVSAFTASLALSVPASIRVNCVAPGWIKTAWGSESASEFWSRRAIDESTRRRWGSPEDVAETIAWLASPAADFISGQCIQVNGGRRYWPTIPQD